MADTRPGPDWWYAADGKWYPPPAPVPVSPPPGAVVPPVVPPVLPSGAPPSSGAPVPPAPVAPSGPPPPYAPHPYAPPPSLPPPVGGPPTPPTSFGAPTFGQRNQFALYAIGITAVYVVVALVTRFALIGIVPVMMAVRSMQRREVMAPVAVLAAIVAVVVGVVVLGHH